MPLYTPPEQPPVSADPFTDVVRAFEWSADFFASRAPAVRIVGSVVRYGITRIL